MNPRHILVIQGHPDPGGGHLCHALAEAYADGARRAGHVVEACTPATLDFGLLRSKREWEDAATLPASLAPVQAALQRADHLVLVFPLWLGDMPALLKGFLEQVARPGFAFGQGERFGMRRLLRGKSARIVVTMGMPASVYRWFFREHGLRLLERNILKFVGIAPVRRTVLGSVEGEAPRQARWLALMRRLGARAG